MLRSFVATAVVGLVLAAGAGASSSSLVYLTVKVGSFDAAVNVDPPSSSPPDCSAIECKFAYEQGTLVTLTAAATNLSPFMRWSGGCARVGSAKVCSGRLIGDTTVGAAFSRLTVHYSAGKGGRIEREPHRTSCGDGCDVFGYHETVVLRAFPDDGYHVDSWSGACEGGAWRKCTISNLATNLDVYVRFARNDGLGQNSYPIGTGSLATVSISGQGTVSGRIAAEDFRCPPGAACKVFPTKGSAVAVTASPATGWKFSRWTGRCVGRSSVCIFMNQPWPSSPVPSVQAVFVPA